MPFIPAGAAINPCTSIAEMRNFAYQYCFQAAALLPNDQAVDELVIALAKKLFNITPMPSRQGVRFIQGKKRGFLISLLAPSEYISDALCFEINDALATWRTSDTPEADTAAAA